MPPWKSGDERTTTFTGSPGGSESVSAFYLFETCTGPSARAATPEESRRAGVFRGGTWRLPLHLNRALAVEGVETQWSLELRKLLSLRHRFASV